MNLDERGRNGGKEKDIGPGKGILKQNQNPQTTSSFLENSGVRIPTRIITKKDILDGSNTTSRINTSNLQNKVKRRVSFAPDVTLHSFTFVPEQNNEIKEPRRRKTLTNSPTKRSSQEEPLVTSTQIDDVRTKEKTVAEDDSDASGMELTEPIVAMPDSNKAPQHDPASMEMTEVFPRSVRQEGPDVGGENTESSQQISDAEAVREETMELTAIHNVHHYDSITENMVEGEPIDLTEYESRPYVPNSVIHSSMRSSDHNVEKRNDKGDVLNPVNKMTSSQPMEITEVFHADLHNPVGVQGEINISDDGNEMELTQIQTNFDRDNYRRDEPSNEKDVLSPNKRRKLDTDPDYVTPVTTPVKGVRDTSVENDDGDLEMMEKMSPITFSDVDNKVGTRSNHASTIETGIGDTSVEIATDNEEHTGDGDDDGNKMVETIAFPEVGKKGQSTIALPTRDYTLREFINEVGVGFLDTKLIDHLDKKVDFPLNSFNLVENQRIDNIFSSYYIDIPILEVEAFRCKELWRSINESKNKFKDFEAQIDQSHPPLLLQEYFSSNEKMKQLMRDQLQLVKGYSKLEAAMEWYEWRKKQLNGLELILAENLTILKGEYEKLNEEVEKVNSIRGKIRKLNTAIKEEIKSLKDSPSDSYKPTLMNTIKIEAFKQELMKHSISLSSSNDFTQEMHSIKLAIAEKSNDLLTLRNEIASIDKKIEKRKLFTRFDLPKLRDTLKILESLTGVRFLKFSKATLSIEFLQLDDLRVDIDLATFKNNPLKSMKVTNDGNKDHVSYHLFIMLLRNVDAEHQENLLSNLFLAMKKWRPLLKYIKLLKLLFPVNIIQTEGREAILQFKDYDRRNKTAVFYGISFVSFAQGVFSESGQIPMKVHITTHQDYSPSREVLSDRIIHKISGILPSFTKSRIHLEFI